MYAGTERQQQHKTYFAKFNENLKIYFVDDVNIAPIQLITIKTWTHCMCSIIIIIVGWGVGVGWVSK